MYMYILNEALNYPTFLPTTPTHSYTHHSVTRPHPLMKRRERKIRQRKSKNFTKNSINSTSPRGTRPTDAPPSDRKTLTSSSCTSW